jgi:hypothetical protein
VWPTGKQETTTTGKKETTTTRIDEVEGEIEMEELMELNKFDVWCDGEEESVFWFYTKPTLFCIF